MSQATAYFSRGKGIISVKGCSDTRRVLLTYDEEATSPANSTLCSLAEVDHVVIEDTALVYTKEEGIQ